jgi:hypothetical protein
MNGDGMDFHGDTGNFLEYGNVEGVNNNNERVILNDFLLPSGLEVDTYIRNDTNTISRDLVTGCKDLGYSVEEKDRLICLMLTRVTRNGIYPSDRTSPENQGFYYDTKAVLIRRGREHVLLLEHNNKHFYIEVKKFKDLSMGKTYNAKLHLKNSKGNTLEKLYIPNKEYNKHFFEKEKPSKDIESLISSTLRTARFVDSKFY